MLVVLYILLLAIFIGSIIYLRIHQAEIRGKVGEACVASILSSLPESYRSFNNVYIKQGNMSAQIDHVVVSPYGVFVIETKNYGGWIYGSDNSAQWVKNVYGHKYYFQNPLRQNFAHIKALQSLSGLPINRFIPIIVFLDRATLKCNTRANVIYASQLQGTISCYITRVLEDADMARLTALLAACGSMDTVTKKSHIENIYQRKYQEESLIAQGVCPRCGGKLIERKGRYGNFRGCSNYPQCKFTLHANNENYS